MRLFRTPPYRDVLELLDQPGQVSEHDLQHTLRDIRRANIFGLGTWVVSHHLTRLLADLPKQQELSILDLATGSADIPEALCRWARKHDRKIHITATDISAEILGVASRRISNAGFADLVRFVACDATDVPFPDGSFDVVVCSLAFHHFNVEAAHRSLGEMERLCRTGFIVNDIYRSRGAWVMAWVLTRLTTTNRLTRHDGPASVLRAFTPSEVARIGTNINVPLKVHTHPFWRMAAVRTSDR